MAAVEIAHEPRHQGSHFLGIVQADGAQREEHAAAGRLFRELQHFHELRQDAADQVRSVDAHLAQGMGRRLPFVIVALFEHLNEPGHRIGHQVREGEPDVSQRVRSFLAHEGLFVVQQGLQLRRRRPCRIPEVEPQVADGVGGVDLDEHVLIVEERDERRQVRPRFSGMVEADPRQEVQHA